MFERRLWHIYCRCLKTVWFKALKKLLEKGKAAKDNAVQPENGVAYLKNSKYQDSFNRS